MASLNKVLVIGNLTRDPELRYTATGSPVCNIGLAVNRKFRDKSDQLKEETTFLRVTVWGKSAENCSKYLQKGRPVFVEGRLESRSWEDKDGKKQTSLDIVADRVDFLDHGGGKGGGGRAFGGGEPPADDVEV